MTSNFVEVIKMCEEAGGAGTKKKIHEALASADSISRRLIREALDPYRVFGVRKFDFPATFATHTPTKHEFEKFFHLLDSLASREITGNSARECVTAVLEKFDAEHQKYLSRIFDKDLKAGFSAETAVKAWKIHGDNNFIPVFDVMLADKCSTTEEFETRITFPCLAEYKYDGERTIAIVKKDSVTYYSRSGKEATHVNGLFDAELFRIRDLVGHDFILDGERYASNFTETMNAKKEGNDEAKNNLKFIAFFMMPLSDWISQETKITTEHNYYYIQKILKQIEAVKIIPAVGREVADYQDMMNLCNSAIDDHGVEGLILKDWNAVYEWDRTFAWTKVKRFYDADCKIVGFYQGRSKSRLENTLGGIVVVGFLENGTRVETNVGSGFSDSLRHEIWNNQQEWLGRTVVIKYQEISKAKDRDVSSLRFPTYERWRDDKEIIL